MVQVVWLIRDKILSFVRDERAQDAFEYLLVIGGVSVAVVALELVVVGTCPASSWASHSALSEAS
jgi:Flp pilus assembly pilin Flp